MNTSLAIEKYLSEMTRTLSDLIRIKSTYSQSTKNTPFGVGNGNALDYVLELCEKVGFKTKNLDGYGAYAEIGTGTTMIAILTHLDVVNEGTGWTVSPFDGVIKNGKVIGRGAYDNKGPVVAAIYALRIIKENVNTLPFRIRVFFGCDEETGFRCIEHYKKTEEIPKFSLVPDAWFPVTNAEKGSLYLDASIDIKDNFNTRLVSIKGAENPNVIAGQCEIVLGLDKQSLSELQIMRDEFQIETGICVDIAHLSNKEGQNKELMISTSGIQCHSSMPELGVDACKNMMKFLVKLNLGGSLGTFVKFYNTLFECEFAKDKKYDLSINAGKFTFIENKLTVKFDIRYPINITSENVLEQIKNIALPIEIQIANVEDYMPMYVDEKSFLVKTLLDVYEKVCNERQPPKTVGFSTYAHSMENAVGFGPYFPDQKSVSHDADESISVQDLQKCTKLFIEGLLRLGN